MVFNLINLMYCEKLKILGLETTWFGDFVQIEFNWCNWLVGLINLIIIPCSSALLLLLLPLWALCFREKSQELFETLNLKRNIWIERKLLLNEFDPAIRENFERWGWLPLWDIDYPPPATLIREFYSNLSIHVYDSNTLVKS